jgi:hypothetical protein
VAVARYLNPKTVIFRVTGRGDVVMSSKLDFEMFTGFGLDINRFAWKIFIVKMCGCSWIFLDWALVCMD